MIRAKADLTKSRSLLERLENKIQDKRPLFEKVAEAVRESNRQRFETDGDGQWEPLKKATVDTKERRGFSTEILVKTGSLKRSLTEKDAPGAIFEATNAQLILGTSIPYARNHQFGRGNNPVRKVIVESDQLVEHIEEAGQEFLSDF